MSEPTILTPSASVKCFPDPIPDIIPFGSLCLFAGASGAGKTIFLTEWIKRWLDGRTICGKPTQCPTGFYYLAADRDWSTYAAALRAAGVDDIPHYVLATDRSLSPSKWSPEEALSLLKTCLDRLKPIPGSVTIIDPLAPLFIKGDQNRARDVAISMHEIRRIGADLQTTMVCMANVAKAKVGEEHRRAQDRISGSGAFVAYTDTQIHLQENDEPAGVRTLGWTPRRGPAEEWQFQFDTETRLFVPYEGGQTGSQTLNESLEDARLQQILALIPEEGIQRKDLEQLIKDQLKISRATIDRDLQKLRQHRLIFWDAEKWGVIRRVKSAKAKGPAEGA
jgi:archaellum biogenesis ATPase FlaH